jgi:hypothetical protein
MMFAFTTKEVFHAVINYRNFIKWGNDWQNSGKRFWDYQRLLKMGTGGSNPSYSGGRDQQDCGSKPA